MFDQVQPAPRDPILGLTEAFHSDPRDGKINLSVGVYQDEQGRTPILNCVKRAETRLCETEASKEYLPITGDPNYTSQIQRLLFGDEHPIFASRCAATAATPGGTGALRVAADFLKVNFPHAKVWLSNPTWPNHPSVFHAAGVETASYPYFDPATGGIDRAAMVEAIGKISGGDVILLHACCHNPTGVDPAPDLWREIAGIVRERSILPLVDFAYQGFADGLREDAAALEYLHEPGEELIVCSSLSKNFGLYRERTGALTIVAGDAEQAAAVLSQVKTSIRANYSNPPAHGGAIAATILADPELRGQWEGELAAMRQRINGMRQLMVERLAAHGVDRDFSFLTRQRGMFSFSGLTPEQVDTLREEHAIYIVRSGRINVAGTSPGNMDRLCAAIAAVL